MNLLSLVSSFRAQLTERTLVATSSAISAVWLIFAVLSISFMPYAQSDFAVFYAAAAILHDHSGSIYDISSIVATAQRHHSMQFYHHPAYLYPPLLAILLEPLVSLTFGQAIQIWVALQLGLWAGSAALIVLWMRRFGTTKLTAITIGLTFGLLCWPLASGILQFAQLDAFVLFCVLLAPWLIVNERQEWGGAVLMLATMIKLIPAVLIIYFLLRGRWRILRGALISGAVLMLFQAIIVGLPELLAMRHITSNSAVFVSQADNFSLLHFPVWLALSLGISISPELSLPGAILVTALAISFVLGTALTRRWNSPAGSLPHSEQATLTDILGYAWAVCAMLLLTPLVWLHYLAWLLAPLALTGGYLLNRPASRHRNMLLILLVAGYLLATVRLPFLYDTTPEYTLSPTLGGYTLRPLAMSLHPLGQILMWVITGIIFMQAAGVRLPAPLQNRETATNPVDLS